jgi:Histidine kinase
MARWGWRTLPWLALGHAIIWRTLGFGPVTGLVPLLYPLEAWLAYYLGYRLPLLREPDRSAMNRTTWRLMVVPWLAAIPCAILIGWAGLATARYTAGSGAMTVAKIAMAHVHGMVAFGPLVIHALKGDFRSRSKAFSAPGSIAAMMALAVMMLAFLGFFRETLGMSSAAYLSFPLVILAGISLRPPAISCFMAVWCAGTSVLTGAGQGPFGGNPLELGIYNLIVCSMAYTLSVGSMRYVRQLRRTEQTLEAAGVELWEWSLPQGFHSISGDRSGNHLGNGTSNRPPLDALGWMTATPDGSLRSVDDRWKVRLEGRLPGAELLVSSGRILARGRDGIPLEAIGILQDLSAIRRAEEALIALGHQRAQLKSLQSRLNPHFLFNALNAIRAMIHLNPRRASDAITTLAKLLRSNLANSDRPLIRLSDEMEAVHQLLSIAAMRFEDRLRTDIVVNREAAAFLVPPMIVFNLVENALVHGIERQPGTGTLRLNANAAGGNLIVTVSNPGRLMEPLKQGVGIGDIRQRIELIFGAAGNFSLSQSSPDVVSAEIVLPASSHELAYC